MDELIKFLPIVLYLVYRAFSAGKGKEEKVKPRPVQQKKQTKQPSSIEDILRELREEIVPEEKPKPVVAKKQAPSKITIEDHQYDFRPEYEHHGKKSKSLAVIRTEIAEDQNNVPILIDADSIDLRQAVVYDAILNRPEF